MKHGLKILISAFMFLCVVNTKAAQLGKVIVDEANVLRFPQSGAEVIDTVTRDQSLVSSNLPTEGYYKVRLPSGDIGWVSGNDILVGVQPTQTPTQKVETKPEPVLRETWKDVQASRSTKGRLIFLGGFQYPSYTGLKDYFITQGINPGLGFGLEWQTQMGNSQSWFWGFRGEYLTSSTGPNDFSSTVAHRIKHTAIPVHVGVIWNLIPGDFRIALGAYAGMALMSSVTATQITSTAENSNTYESYDLSGLLSAQAGYALGDSSELFFEAAYHYWKSGEFPAANGIPATSIDYSGLQVRVGLGFFW